MRSGAGCGPRAEWCEGAGASGGGGGGGGACPPRRLPLSLQIFKEAQDLLPGGVNSPVRAFKSVGGQPIVFDRVKVRPAPAAAATATAGGRADSGGRQYSNVLQAGHSKPQPSAALRRTVRPSVTGRCAVCAPPSSYRAPTAGMLITTSTSTTVGGCWWRRHAGGGGCRRRAALGSLGAGRVRRGPKGLHPRMACCAVLRCAARHPCPRRTPSGVLPALPRPVGSWGPAIVGACNDEVNEALKAQIEKGTSFGAPCELEVRCVGCLLCLRRHRARVGSLQCWPTCGGWPGTQFCCCFQLTFAKTNNRCIVTDTDACRTCWPRW